MAEVKLILQTLKSPTSMQIDVAMEMAATDIWRIVISWRAVTENYGPRKSYSGS